MPLHPVEEIGEGRGDRQGTNGAAKMPRGHQPGRQGLKGTKLLEVGTPTASGSLGTVVEPLETADTSTVSLKPSLGWQHDLLKPMLLSSSSHSETIL